MSILNKKFIAWGHKPGVQNTFGYIHASFYKAFQFMGYEVLHLDNNDNIEGINFDNAIFFTHGPVDQNIPLIKTAKYILHHCNEEKYQNFKYIKYQVYASGKENCHGFHGEKIDAHIYYDKKTKDIFLPWATDLLPHEIEDHFQPKNNKRCVFVGTKGGSYHGNLAEWAMVEKSCTNHGYTFEHYPPFSFSFEDNKKIINGAEIAPAILGRWQNINDYIPCRFFKNISYGQLGITNSQSAYQLVEGNAIFNTPEKLINDYLSLNEEKKKRMFENSIKLIKENHTYINRIHTLLRFLQ